MSRRKAQLAAEIRRILGRLLSEGLADPRVSGIVSITTVDVSPDGKQALVGVSVLPAEKQTLAVQGLRAAASHLRGELGKRMRTRSLPKLRFEEDASLKREAGVLAAIRQAVEEDEGRRSDTASDDAGVSDVEERGR